MGIHFGSAAEIIECTHAIPDAKRGSIPANQQRRGTGKRVFRGAGADAGFAFIIENLITFTLADRVVAKHNETVFGQRNTCPLVCLGCLAIGAMPAGKQNARERPLALRHIKRCSNVVSRPTLKNHLLHSETNAGQSAGYLRAKRCLVWKTTESRHELFPQAILPLADLFRRLQLLYFLTPMLKVLATLVEQKVVKLFARVNWLILLSQRSPDRKLHTQR
jgi:hypothetical protein